MVFVVFLTVPIPRLRKLICHSKLKWDPVLPEGKENLEKHDILWLVKVAGVCILIFCKPILWWWKVSKIIYMLISNTADMKYYFLVWLSRYSVAFWQGRSCRSDVMVFYIPCPRKSPTQCRRATALQTWLSCHLLSGKECLGRGGMLSISREDTAILISYHVCQSCAQHKDTPAQAVPSCPVHVFHDPFR